MDSLTPDSVENMHWCSAVVAVSDHQKIFDAFEQLYIDKYKCQRMLLISVPLHEMNSRFFWGASNVQVLPHYLNFSPVAPDRLPKEATLLIGEQTLFEKWFKFPQK